MPAVMCAMNDGKEANLGIFFGVQEKNRLYFCSEGCRQRYGLIGVSKIAMAEIEARKKSKTRKRKLK